MPTLLRARLPKPKDWQDFEDMVHDVLEQKWGTTLTKNGRGGFEQNGIDFYGEDDCLKSVGVQCKNHQESFSMSIVSEDLEKAKKFFKKLDAIYFVVSTESDPNLLKSFDLLSRKRIDEGLCPVKIFFWEDVVRFLLVNESVFKKHYPYINFPENVDCDHKKRLVLALDLGFKLSKLPAFLMSMEYEDEDRFVLILRNVLSSVCCAVRQLFCEDVFRSVAEEIDEIDFVVTSFVNESMSFSATKLYEHGKNIVDRIEPNRIFLSVLEQRIFSIGFLLGEHDVYQTYPSDNVLEDLYGKLRIAFSDYRNNYDKIVENIEIDKKEQLVYKWMIEVYKRIRAFLLWEERL